MESQPDIGGARALLLLGKGDEEAILDSASDPDPTLDSKVSSSSPHSPRATNQQINDAVVAAVMKYVGGLLEQGAPATEHATLTSSLTPRKRRKMDDVAVSVSDVDDDEFSQWTGFLAENMNQAHHQDGDFYSDHTSNDFSKDFPKEPARKKYSPLSQSLGIELPDLDSSSVNDHLNDLSRRIGGGVSVEAELSPGRALAQFGSSPVRRKRDASLGDALIDKLARAASCVAEEGSPPRSTSTKDADIDDSIINYGVHPRISPASIKVAASKARPTSDLSHITSVEVLIEEASRITCLWFFSLPDNTKKGPRKFSKQEIDGVEHFIQGYCHLYRWSRDDACKRIWLSERKKDNFWESLTRVLPYRSRASVYKHVRRQYHVFSVRAKWTAEEEEVLRQWGITHEGKWKEIGEAMGRMPEDCRDRWRNYVKCGSNRSSNTWLPEEETRLRTIVMDILGKSPISDSNLAVNWTVVSERMNGTRSRIQCRYKWTKIRKRESLAKSMSMTGPTISWLIYQLQRTGSPDYELVDWARIAQLVPAQLQRTSRTEAGSERWLLSDLKYAFEKMRSDCKDAKRAQFMDLLSRLAQKYGPPPQFTNELSDGIPSGATLHQNVNAQASTRLDDPAAIANLVVSAVPSSVPEELAQQQQYSLWR